MQKLIKLKETLKQEWETLLANSTFVKAIRTGDYDPRLYAIYMVETYHYTLHNARNQALVGVRAMDISPQYLNFCFHHAAEEAGHELMAIHDLKRMGYSIDIHSLPTPLMATEQLVAYVYWVSLQGNPLQRLGYSFWAETSYGYVNPLIYSIKEKLKLSDDQMTFFIAHSDIDTKHAEEVERMIMNQAKTEADWESIERVMKQTLRLTGLILEDVMKEYMAVASGKSHRFPH